MEHWPTTRNNPRAARAGSCGFLQFPSTIYLRCFVSQKEGGISRDAAFLLTIGSFLLTVELFYLQLTVFACLLTVGAFLLTVLASLLTVGAFFAYSGKVRLIRALRDCEQRSLTVSKEAPTVSKRASPDFKNQPKVFPL